MSETRDRIITATNELFRRQGFHATGLKEISTASGATIGSIYHFFPGGKERLGVAVIESTGAAYRELFDAILDESPDDDPASGFERFFAAAADTLAESDYIDPCPIGTVAREIANTSEPMRLAADGVFASWVDAARSRLTSAGVGQEDTGRLATVFVAMVEGSFVLSRTSRSADALLAAGRTVGDLVRNAAAANAGT
ncbi:MAG: TetR/AcrR family transcriptional regulator [Actinomycetota bacterium]